MINKVKVFIDADVFLSALRSSTGAANYLITQSSIEPITSNQVCTEVQRYLSKLEVDIALYQTFVSKFITVVQLENSLTEIGNVELGIQVYVPGVLLQYIRARGS